MTDGPLQAILARFPGKRVLVVGDVMLDAYVWGTVRRISPEAPVPVVEVQRRSYVPGGAANTAANVAGLGGLPLLVGVLGDDEAGKQLRAALAERHVSGDGLLIDASRTTTTKTRIIAHSQQVVRLDHEERSPLAPALEERLLQRVEERLPCAEVCVLSDYDKGVVSSALARWLMSKCRAAGKTVIVDPKGADFGRYEGATLIKPNLQEAGLFLRREVRSAEDLLEVGTGLLAALRLGGALITRGADGMSLFEPGAEPTHIAAQAREVYDVTGAGDTVAATLALALAAGGSPEQAARLASRAAAIIVGRVGTTAVRWEELAATAGLDG